MTRKNINIVADENILGLDIYFKNTEKVSFTIKKMSGRFLQNSDLVGCDVLLVRSVTKVNEALLKGTSVCFVGTATSGMEHVDENYLQTNKIYFAHAKGANANAVAEYIISSIAYLSLQNKKNYFKKTIAIVGHGFVGRALEKKLNAFNSSIKIYDPYLRDSFVQNNEISLYCNWDDVIKSDLISMHVPFTDGGEYPTKNMLNAKFFSEIKNNIVLLNAARGEICDENALLKKIVVSDIKVVLDVWNNEPNICKTLLTQATVASPHVAGYSLEAKLSATELLASQVFDYFDITKDKEHSDQIERTYLDYNKPINNVFDICELILQVYNPILDTESLRESGTAALEDHFDALRKHYFHRREWKHFDLSLLNMNKDLKALLHNLGFYFSEKYSHKGAPS